MRRFNVVIPLATGGVEVHPMKEWLRQHPKRMPEQLNSDIHTSHRIRDALRRAGWAVQEMAEEVRLLPPEASLTSGVIENVLGQEESLEDEVAEIEETAFHLENQLRDFIAHNLAAINFGGPQLSLFSDDNGRGVEYRTPAGSIDILATDSTGALYVFELKRAKSPDQTIGQLARYMGALRHRFGGERHIGGVIVAMEITQNLRYAIAAIPNVRLFEYKVKFSLEPAEHIRDDS